MNETPVECDMNVGRVKCWVGHPMPGILWVWGESMGRVGVAKTRGSTRMKLEAVTKQDGNNARVGLTYAIQKSPTCHAKRLADGVDMFFLV